MRAVEFYYVLDKTFKPDTDYIRVRKDRDRGKNVSQHYYPDRTRIYIACTVDSRYLKVAVGYRVRPVEWDFRYQKANNSHPNNLKLNSYLSRLKVKANDEYIQMMDKGMTISYDTVKQMLKKLVGSADVVKVKKDFWGFFDEFLKERAKLKKAETIAKYNSLKVSLVKFEKEHFSLSFEKMNMKFYEDFLYYSQTKLNHLNNTISKNLRGLKTFLKWGYEMKYHQLEDYKAFKCSNDPTEPMFLTLEEFKRFEAFDAGSSAGLELARDIFVFQCYTGQRISDIEALRKKDIKKDNSVGHYWELYQQKGSKRHSIKIPMLRGSLTIYDKYSEHKKSEEAVFSIGSTQLINKNLKKIGQAIGLDEVITKVNFQGSKRVEKTTKKYEILSTHMARKTFVTLALEAGMGAEQIRTITGHTSVAQMRPYTGVDRTKVMEGMEKAFGN